VQKGRPIYQQRDPRHQIRPLMIQSLQQIEAMQQGDLQEAHLHKFQQSQLNLPNGRIKAKLPTILPPKSSVNIS
jgi:hypothetical protein